MTDRYCLEGAPNFRDLGGIVASDGCRIKSGVLFRSGDLSRLTDFGLGSFATLNIELLFDLRSVEERILAPNRWPAYCAPESVCSGKVEGPSAVKAFDWRKRVTDPTFDVLEARRVMRKAYEEMPCVFAKTIKNIFKKLCSRDFPVILIHCTAGKDRTGFVCAILLFALGVQRDDVFKDYLLSGTLQSPLNLLQAVLGNELLTLTPATYAALFEMSGVCEEYLDIALCAIDRQFGSLDLYLSKVCGLKSSDRALLQARLLPF